MGNTAPTGSMAGYFTSAFSACFYITSTLPQSRMDAVIKLMPPKLEARRRDGDDFSSSIPNTISLRPLSGIISCIYGLLGRLIPN